MNGESIRLNKSISDRLKSDKATRSVYVKRYNFQVSFFDRYSAEAVARAR